MKREEGEKGVHRRSVSENVGHALQYRRAEGVRHLIGKFKSPRTQHAAAADRRPGSHESISTRKETILLIHEDEGLRTLGKIVLSTGGYNVLTAKDGEQAMRVFSRHSSDIALVFSDIALPKLGGDRLLQRMQKIDPHVRVIFAGGYIDSEVRSALLSAGAVECIENPQSALDIISTIRTALHHP